MDLSSELFSKIATLPEGHLSKNKSSIPKDAEGKEWKFVLQKHFAVKSKEHYDLRLGNPETGVAHSWAGRYFPTKVGEVRLFRAQPDHSVDYMSYSGLLPVSFNSLVDTSKYDLTNKHDVKKLVDEIKEKLESLNRPYDERYGAGVVGIESAGTATILKVSPDKITFSINSDDDKNGIYSLIRLNGDQFLLRKNSNIVKNAKGLTLSGLVDLINEFNKSGLELRTPTLEERKQILEILSRTKFLAPQTKEEKLLAVDRTLNHPMMVVKDKDKLVAFINFNIRDSHFGHRGYIRFVYVNPDYRGKAISKKLITIAEKFLPKPYWMLIDRDNKIMIDNVKKLGYYADRAIGKYIIYTKRR